MQHGSRRTAVVLAAALLLGARARAEVQTTIAESTQAGRHRYLSNFLTVNVAPIPELALDAGGGRSRAGSLFSDSSAGGGVWAEVMPRLSLSLHLDRFNGEKGFTEDLRTGEFLYDNAQRQRTNTVTLGATVKVWGAAGRDEDEEAAAAADARTVKEVRISLGGSRGTLHVPVTTIGPLGRRVDSDFTQRQTGASAGVNAVITETDLGVAYRRNRYGDLAPPVGSTSPRRPVVAFIAERIRTSVAQVLSEPVLYGTQVSVSESLPHAVAFYGAFDYAVLQLTRDIARTTTVELTWDVTTWFGIKAGGLWVRERKKTTPYLLAGANLYF